YSADGIGTIDGGTITTSNPATIALQALSGGDVITDTLVWNVERLDDSTRKNPDINILTGVLTLYENGVYRISASDYANGKYGAITVYANLQIEGESADDGNGAKLDDAQAGASGGLNAGSTGTSWMKFDGIKLERLTGITFRASKNSGDSVINVSLLPYSDWTIAQTTLPATGSWSNWTEVTTEINRNELGRMKLDENGCGTIYVQTNSANLDYITLNYNYDTVDAYNRADGKITTNVSLESGKLTATVSGTENDSVEITGPGAYTLKGFAEGDAVTITADDGVNKSTGSITYSVPAPRNIYVYNFSDSIYDGFFSASEGMTIDSGIGIFCEGGFDSNKGISYTHTNGVTYTYTRSLRGGSGSAGTRRVYFTPDYDGVVSAVFSASTDRVMNIEQGGEKVTKNGVGDGTAIVVQLNVKAGIPVYVYGGGSNKYLFGILFEPGKAATPSTPTPEPTPSPTPIPVPETDRTVRIESEKYSGNWTNRSNFGITSAGTGTAIQNTNDGDILYYGQQSMDNLKVITVNAAQRSDQGNVTVEFFAADTSGMNVSSASKSQIEALLTASNSLGSTPLTGSGNWNTYCDNNVIVTTEFSGTRGLFVKLSSTGKYAGNHDYIDLKYKDGTAANVLTAANENGKITINGSVVTITENDGTETTVDYNEISGQDVTFKKVIDWDGSFTALAYNSKSDKTEIIGGTSLNIWADQTPVSYSEKDENAPDKPVINDICAVGDQLYAVCDGGYMITMTPCAKCSSIKKVCDFDIEIVEADDSALYLIGSDDEAEISIVDARQTNIKGEAALELIADGAIAVDVRTTDEYAKDSLDGAVNIPIDEFGDWISEQDADTTIIVYCKSGKRAAQAAEIAAEQGFINIYNVGSIDNLK
ncbi:MAG: carbohydrate-binding protein, partial [Oscillospiraceae bacterium]|nr:carbohydrate-binding protein [Oscillospiraceae bacterium]